MPNFIRGIPASDSPIRSSEIRNNFLALDDRTGKIGARATIPSSTSILIDGGVVYYGNRVSINMEPSRLDLGDQLTGVQQFYNIGYFKDIAIVARVTFNSTSERYEASTFYIEGPEKATNLSQPELIPLAANDLPIARLVVRHNGIDLVSRGQIEPINQDDILDYRNYLDVGGVEYFSAVVGDRRARFDSYGAVALDSYGFPILDGETIGTFVDRIIVEQDLVSRNVYYSNSIQEAIDSLEGKGGTILLKRGTYLVKETLTIPSNIHLLGEGRSTKLVVDNSFAGPMINVEGDSVILEKINFIGALPDIGTVTEGLVRLYNSNFSTIKDCTFEDALKCLEILTGTQNIVTNNFFLSSNFGVRVLGSSAVKNFIGLNHFNSVTTPTTDSGTSTVFLSNITSP